MVCYISILEIGVRRGQVGIHSQVLCPPQVLRNELYTEEAKENNANHLLIWWLFFATNNKAPTEFHSDSVLLRLMNTYKNIKINSKYLLWFLKVGEEESVSCKYNTFSQETDLPNANRDHNLLFPLWYWGNWAQGHFPLNYIPRPFYFIFQTSSHWVAHAGLELAFLLPQLS